MILRLSLFLPLLFSVGALAFDKDFRIESDRVPTEFALLFDSMKLEVKTPKEKVEMVGLIQELGENLGSLEKDQIFLLLKSEVIKDVLEHRFDKVRQFDMTNLLVERLEADYQKKQKYLNPFAQWIWRSILAELRYRQKLGLISEKTFTPQSFTGPKLAEAQRFQRYLNYLTPWIDRMDSLSAPEFNQLVKEVSWTVLKRINERSVLFKRYASTLATDKKIRLFNIPQRLLEIHPEELKRIRSGEEEEGTLVEASKKAREEATEAVEKVTPDDMSTVSEDVIKEVDKQITPPAKNP